MELGKNVRSGIFLLLYFSVFLGPILYMILFFNPQILNSYWSWEVNNLTVAQVSALAFICFFVLFLLTFRFIKKLTKYLLIVSFTGIAGLGYLYLGLIWLYEFYFIIVIINGAILGFISPIIISSLSNFYPSKNLTRTDYYMVGIAILIWVGIAIGVFIPFGAEYWRYIYMGTGCVNIVAAVVLALLKVPRNE